MIVAPFGYAFVKIGNYYILGVRLHNPAFPLFTTT